MNAGAITLFLHDISDTFLFLGRISNDFKLEVGFYTYFIFGMTLISWFLSRLVYFPLKVIIRTTTYSFSNLYNSDI